MNIYNEIHKIIMRLTKNKSRDIIMENKIKNLFNCDAAAVSSLSVNLYVGNDYQFTIYEHDICIYKLNFSRYSETITFKELCNKRNITEIQLERFLYELI